MEDIFKSFSTSIPFLIFKQIKDHILAFCKVQVSHELKISKIEDQISIFSSHLTASTIPDHLQKQLSKIVSADIDPLQISSLYSSALKIEISKVEARKAKLNSDFKAVEQDFLRHLTEMLDIANFSPLPTDGTLWEEFSNLYFLQLLRSLHSALLLSAYVKNVSREKKKFEKMKALKNTPIVITENSLQALFKKFSNVSVSQRTKPKKPKTSKNSKQALQQSGKGKRSSKSGESAKETVRKAGRRASSKSKN